MLVPISDAQAQELETYSEVSGVSVEELIAEAVGEYLECALFRVAAKLWPKGPSRSVIL